VSDPGCPLLQIRGLSRRFGEGEGALEILAGLELELSAGERIAITGPSGSGKSTLLNLIGGLDPAAPGSVLFEGRDLGALTEDELAAHRNRMLGFVFQGHHLLPQCSALENVLIPTLVSGTGAEAEERGRALLERVGLGGRMSHRPGQLSGGERQRVAVVRALINKPRLVLADEPTGSLDRAAASELGALLCELNEEEGVALIVVTHSEELAGLMGRRYELRGGRLESVGQAAGAEGAAP